MRDAVFSFVGGRVLIHSGAFKDSPHVEGSSKYYKHDIEKFIEKSQISLAIGLVVYHSGRFNGNK